MSGLTYAERMALRNAATLRNAQFAYDNASPPEPDPRDEALLEMRLESEARKAADMIIQRAAEAVAHIDDPRDRLATQVGRLQGEIRRLCAELAWAREGAE